MEPLLWWGIGLMAVALLLMVLELFVPSMGVLLLTAVAVAIAGVVCLWRVDTAWGIIGMLVLVLGGPALFGVGLSLWQHTPMGRKMIGAQTLEEQEAARAKEEEERRAIESLVGAEGVAVTELRPVGIVRIGDRRYDALAETFMIPSGSRVKVVHADAMQIKVRLIS